jgi:Zn-dependent protease with chaperone function
MRALTAAACWLIALAAAGCSTPPPPPPLVVDASGADRERLFRVGGTLAWANATLCSRTIGVIELPAAGGKPASKRCAITIRLLDRPGIGVAAEGNELWVSTGMLRFARDDGELATVLAHRLAHLLASYPNDAPPLLSRVGLGGTAAPEPVFDPASERAADRLSLFLLANADVEPAIALRFWQRLATLPPDGSDWLLRHPVTHARLEAIAGVVTEIKMLRDAHQALVP